MHKRVALLCLGVVLLGALVGVPVLIVAFAAIAIVVALSESASRQVVVFAEPTRIAFRSSLRLPRASLTPAHC